MEDFKNIFMKKLYIFTVFFLFILGNSQTYSFDFLTNYTFENTDKKYSNESVNYFNSDDFSYYLKIVKLPERFTGTLYDTNTNKAHCFTITESKVKGEIIFTFQYDYSYDLKPNRATKNFRVEFTTLPETSPQEVTMKFYSSKKAKKSNSESTLILKPANKNLFPMYRLSRTALSDSMTDDSVSGNYSVERELIKEGKATCEFVLKEYKNVELDLVVPTPLK